MILCADDYGMSPAVSQGIRELIEQGRISSASAMVIGTHAAEELGQLKRWRGQVEVGLHLTLTNDAPLSRLSPETGLTDARGRLLPFPRLLRNTYRGAVDGEAVRDELDAQLACFEHIMGSPPDYLDGHQHIQQLPVIRDVVARCAEGIAARAGRCYVRVAGLPMAWAWRMARAASPKLAMANLAIAYPGLAMQRLLARRGLRHNRFLLGFYDYEDGSRFEDIFRLYVSLRPQPQDVFFCHPGYVDQALRQRDPLAASRLDALTFLQSSRSQELLAASGVGINTFFVQAAEEAGASV